VIIQAEGENVGIWLSQGIKFFSEGGPEDSGRRGTRLALHLKGNQRGNQKKKKDSPSKKQAQITTKSEMNRKGRKKLEITSSPLRRGYFAGVR